jgi:hypothetical protein
MIEKVMKNKDNLVMGIHDMSAPPPTPAHEGDGIPVTHPTCSSQQARQNCHFSAFGNYLCGRVQAFNSALYKSL